MTLRWPVSLKKSIPAFEIKLQKSTRLTLLLMLVFGFAFLSCWLNGLTSEVKTVLSLALFIYLLRTFSTIRWLDRGCSRIRCNADGYWQLIDDKGGSIRCSLCATSAILGPFVFLHFVSKKKRLARVLLRDSMSSEENRRLRMTLTLYGEQLMAVKG